MSRTVSSPTPAIRRAPRYGKRLLWRLGGGLLVLWAVATLTFLALRLMPGDPVLTILGGTGNATPETIAQTTREYGLDKPLAVQYAVYLGRLVMSNGMG